MSNPHLLPRKKEAVGLNEVSNALAVAVSEV